MAELARAREQITQSAHAAAAAKRQDLEILLQHATEGQQKLQEELRELDAKATERRERSVGVLVDTFRSLATQQRQAQELSLHERRRAIGRVVVVHDQGDWGGAGGELWDDGEKPREVRLKMKALNQEKNDIEAQRKKLQRHKTSLSKKQHSAAADDEGLGLGLDAALGRGGDGDDAAELMLAEEVFKLRLTNLKRDLSSLQAELDALEQQKKLLLKDEKLFLDESMSKFSGYPVLDSRYLFLNMLGKGGFSEVFKAFDLQEMRLVACKVHQLNAAWSEERRRNYLKHVVRESTIQRALDHPKAVRLLDVFKLDSATLVTVLDFCDGGDLDQYLKLHEALPEKEARVIALQVFAGLRYLNQQKQKIIHYDMKPANILFHQGQAKISDFGLSKLVQEDMQSIELTSQGAGTLPYLPPECFIASHAPHITSAVDVWSCGVIFFQMLYGRRPFADDDAAARTKPVEFPAKPAVSEATKDFIRRCLSVAPGDRPKLLTIFDDPFVKSFK
jgi:tousled-like kinase